MAPYATSKSAKIFVSWPEHQRIGFAAVLASFLLSLVFFTVLDPYMNTIQTWTIGAKSSLSAAITAAAATNSTTAQVPAVVLPSQERASNQTDVPTTLRNHIVGKPADSEARGSDANSAPSISHKTNLSASVVSDPSVPATTATGLLGSQEAKFSLSAAITTAAKHSTAVQVPAVHIRQENSTNQNDVPTTMGIYIAGKPADSKARGTDGNGTPSISHQTNLSALVVPDALVPATTTTGRGSQEGRFQRQRPVCDVTDKRSEVCEIDEGLIRINGNSSMVVFYTAAAGAGAEESPVEWRIRPYARKGDSRAMGSVKEVLVKAEPWPLQTRTSSEVAPACSVNYTVPAVIFSTRGYTGNLFHDFTDVMVPLFLTARRYGGEVQLLATGMNLWWVHKYQRLLSALSHYAVIDFDRDPATRCFPRVTVGLYCHKELSIVPSRSPEGYSMPDFTRFLRTAYSLDRHTPIRLRKMKEKRKSPQLPADKKKPRLFLISRKRTRAWVNVGEVITAAEELGYQVVTAEANISTNVTNYAHEVNSCDVMLGVHGAGLTNLVFLPPGAVVIQVVPWGGLEGICRYDFGYAAVDMGLRYLQYSITPEESSLLDKYPRDHPIFTNSVSFHKKGWDALKTTFLDQQDVNLDVRRFKGVLIQALELLGR